MPLLYDSWLKAYRHDSAFARELDSPLYFKEQTALVDGTLLDPRTRVLVAHKPDELNVVYGYMVMTERQAEEPLLHFIFIKEAFRSKGVATALYAEGIGPDGAKSIATHMTSKGRRASSRHLEITFNPYVRR